MHKTSLAILGFGLLLLAVINPAGAYHRNVLLEDFTNWG